MRRGVVSRCAGVLGATGLAAAALSALSACKTAHGEVPPARAHPSIALAPVAADALCVTHGAIHTDGDALRVTEPTVRAFARGTSGDAAALRFTYNGPSASSRRLASGQLRRQLGLKLRAADGCNLVYVMWRLEPKPGLEVSVKRNPGAHDHDDCGADGYTKVKSRQKLMPAPTLAPGDAHTLQAEIIDDELAAWIDGVLVWQGPLGDPAAGLTGPAGLRTDDVDADLALTAAAAPADTASPACPK